MKNLIDVNRWIRLINLGNISQKKKIITKLHFPHSYSFQSQKRNNQTFLINDINIR